MVSSKRGCQVLSKDEEKKQISQKCYCRNNQHRETVCGRLENHLWES